MDRVVDLRAGAAGGFEAEADFDAFDGLNGHDRLGNATIELEVPLGMRSEAEGNAFDADFEDATERIAGFAGFVDEVLDFGITIWVERVNLDGVAQLDSPV